MQKKIIGFLICILLMVTSVPAVESIIYNTINTAVPNTPLKGMAASWIEMHKFLPSDTVGEDVFGCSVSLSGDTALIGAMYDHENGYDAGAAYVFTRTGTTWTQQQKILASDGVELDQFGCSVSLNGDTALIGAYHDDDNGNESGSAYVFTRTGTTWTQQAKLLASEGAAGDFFGWSVALSGDTALIGAKWDNDNGDQSGSAYVFTRTGTTWTQQAKLLASDSISWELFGGSVALDNDTVLIGAIGYEHYKGSTYVFIRTGITWTEQTKLFTSCGAEDEYDWEQPQVTMQKGTTYIPSLFLELIERLMQRFPNAFPLLRHLAEY